ncbi:DNA polymerase [Favolaschia claudopus]|uniref:DNA polymerase n=1 Tax=Favolaschia claudopus TaxID=2862362 RepID=A0AAW0D7J9_9AGAR
MLLGRGRLLIHSRACLRLRGYSTQGPNHAILDMLRSHKEEESKLADKNVYKIKAFTDAIRVIGQLDHPVSASEAKTLRGVGPGIYRRIQEYLAMSSGEEVDSEALERSKLERAAQTELEEVSGIGPVKARQLVAAGCRSIEQLRTTPEFMSMLTNIQRIGVTYSHHIEARVSREEAENVAQAIRNLLSVKYEVILGGSYRRGAPHSSDIDLIILHPDHVYVPFPTVYPDHIEIPPDAQKRKIKAKNGNGNGNGNGKRPPSLFKDDVLPVLESRGITAATLASGDLKWQGIVLLPDSELAVKGDQLAERKRRVTAITNGEGAYRRADLNLVAQKSRGAALLSLTGDIDFNRDLRLRAAKVGMHLNEFGLWRWNENDVVPHEGFWELVRGETEEEVLRELGLEYIPPEKRNFSALGRTVVQKRKSKKRSS